MNGGRKQKRKRRWLVRRKKMKSGAVLWMMLLILFLIPTVYIRSLEVVETEMGLMLKLPEEVDGPDLEISIDGGPAVWMKCFTPEKWVGLTLYMTSQIEAIAGAAVKETAAQLIPIIVEKDTLLEEAEKRRTGETLRTIGFTVGGVVVGTLIGVVIGMALQ